MTKVAAYGMGRIGSEVAYLSAVSGFADELVAYDIMPEYLNAQTLDILHAKDIPISSDVADMKDADYCIVSAGYSRSPDIKTRADLFDKNLPIAREIAKALEGFSGKLIVATNPMDVFTWYFSKYAGFDEGQVVGFGGLLDSRRFSLALEAFGIKEEAIVIGEHGDHQVPLFSQAASTAALSQDVREGILTGLQGSSMPIIKGKGGTVFGPAYLMFSMMERIERGEEFVCSVPANGEYGIEGCALGLLARVTKNGVKINENLKLDDWEQSKLKGAAEFLKGLCKRV